MAGTSGVGSALRRARELRGISVDEASRDTKLSGQQIDALENETYQDLGGELRLSVSGSIRFAASSHEAFLVDGLMRVDASYTIEPNRIGVGHELS